MKIKKNGGKAKSKPKKEDLPEVEGTQQPHEEPIIPGILPSSIVSFVAARKKLTFTSDFEEEIVNQKPARRKKQQTFGPETVLLNEILHAQCLQNYSKILNKRKMLVTRSAAILKNADQVLRLFSWKGNLLSKS